MKSILAAQQRATVRATGYHIVDQLVDDFSRPSFRAGLAASMLTTVMLTRTRLPFFMVLAISLLTGSAVEDLYAMATEIHAKLDGQHAASED